MNALIGLARGMVKTLRASDMITCLLSRMGAMPGFPSRSPRPLVNFPIGRS